MNEPDLQPWDGETPAGYFKRVGNEINRIVQEARDAHAALQDEVERLRAIDDDLSAQLHADDGWIAAAVEKDATIAALINQLSRIETLVDETGSGFPYVSVHDLNEALER